MGVGTYCLFWKTSIYLINVIQLRNRPVANWVDIGAADGFLLVRYPAIAWTNADVSPIWPSWPNFNESSNTIQICLTKNAFEIVWKTVAVLCMPSCINKTQLTRANNNENLICITNAIVKPESETQRSLREMERLALLQRIIASIISFAFVALLDIHVFGTAKIKAGCIYYQCEFHANCNHRSQPTGRAKLLVGCLKGHVSVADTDLISNICRREMGTVINVAYMAHRMWMIAGDTWLIEDLLLFDWIPLPLLVY